MQFPTYFFFYSQFVNYEIVLRGNDSFGGIKAARFTVLNWDCQIASWLLKVEHMLM